jgi:hypothetical protein
LKWVRKGVKSIAARGFGVGKSSRLLLALCHLFYHLDAVMFTMIIKYA